MIVLVLDPDKGIGIYFFPLITNAIFLDNLIADNCNDNVHAVSYSIFQA